MNNIDFNSKDYKRSRASYMAQCTIEYFISLLVADAFLATLLNKIGLSDSLVGIISSFISLAFLFQLLSIGLVKVMKNTKRTVITFDSISCLFFVGIYAVPFIPVSQGIKTIIVIAMLLVAYVFKYLVIGIYFKWANSFVSPDRRGVYSATKEMISLITGIVFTLIIGYVVDRYTAGGNIEGSFVFLGVMIFILSVMNFITLVLISKDRTDDLPKGDKTSLKVVAQKTFKNKNFVNIILLTVLYDVGRYASLGFMGIYKTKDLALTVGFVQIINMIACLARFFISRPFGRFSDKTSFATGINLALFIAALGFFINMFTTPSTWWLIIVFTVLNTVSVAGLNQNMYNICYSYVESDYIVQAMAIKNSIGGIAGFLASLGAAKLLEYIQSKGNVIFGLHVYGQQFLSAISFVILITATVFCYKVIRKQQVMKQ